MVENLYYNLQYPCILKGGQAWALTKNSTKGAERNPAALIMYFDYKISFSNIPTNQSYSHPEMIPF